MKTKSDPGASPFARLLLVQAAVDTQRTAIDAKRYKAQRRLTGITLIQLVALAATPVFLGLSNMDTFNWYTVVGMILSAIAALTGSLVAVFSYRERWSNFVRVSGNLQEIKLTGELLATKGDLVSDEDVDKFRAEYQRVLSNGNSQWQKAVTSSKSSGA